MAKSYAELMTEIQALQSEAEQRRREEIDGVIQRIKEAIATYGLKPSDLGFGRAKNRAASAVRKPRMKSVAPRSKATGAPKKIAPKYRDGAGNTWSGRGLKPRWLTEAIKAGKKIEDFAI